MQEEKNTPQKTEEIMNEFRERAADLRNRHANTNEIIEKLNVESKEHIDNSINKEP